MWFCILGALACGTSATLHIRGPVGYAPSDGTNYAWNYAAYYSVPIQNGQRLTIPAYANPAPIVILSTDRPGQPFQPAVTVSYSRH
jgi:hypothetical protein